MKKIDFIHEFRTQAGQLNSYAIAGDWMRLTETLAADGITLTAADAARWATAGRLPAEAEPLIRDRVTPESAAELDDLATDIAGGSDERAAQIIDDMVRDGVLVDPALVRWREDPDDPDRIIVDVRRPGER